MYIIWELAHLLTKFILTLIIKKQRKLTSRSRTWSISLLTRHSWVRMYWLPKSGSGRTLALQYTIILLYNNSELRISLSLNVKIIQLCQKINPIKSFLLSIPKNFSTVILEQLWTSQHLPQTSILNWRAQSKNNPLIFRPFLKVSTCQNSTTSEHFQKWLKNQGIILALSPPIINQIHVCLKGLSTYICVELYKVTVN